jgi:hypothetical protein
MKKALVAGAVLALASVGWLWAQPVAQNQISGNECWNAGQGPGGPSQFLCIPQVRNGADMNIFSGAGAVTTQVTQQNSTLYWSGTAPTTWTITLTSPPFDGQLIRVSTDTTLTTLVTIVAGTVGTLNSTYNAQTITANTTVAWQFDQPTLKWYRLQ